jgi:flagellar biosynthetic protein FliR
MSPFQFDEAEILTFFAVLVRYSVLFSLLPFLGDRVIPVPLKVLFSVAVTIVLFPSLVKLGLVVPGEAQAWSANAGGIARIVASEALFAAVLGFTARFVFDSISFGANLVGTFMGFASATQFDPHHESQTQIVAEFYLALAMLVFLALDGHHLMLRAALDSYRWVGVGQVNLSSGTFSEQLLMISTQVFKYGLQLAAPVGIAIFTVNVAFGVLSKAMPQLNVLVLSFSVTALIGLAVMFFSLSDFQGLTAQIFERMGDWMGSVSRSISGTGR